MITALVQFKLPGPLLIDAARELFAGSAAKFQNYPGLHRKYFLLSEDGMSAGGVYLWESREQADQMYTQTWREELQARFGSAPTITWFDTPMIIDNLTNEVISA